MFKRQKKLKKLPLGWSKESKDFTERLLILDPEGRLGSSGIHELIKHPWFDGFQWE